jgi:hypothetical protein
MTSHEKKGNEKMPYEDGLATRLSLEDEEREIARLMAKDSEIVSAVTVSMQDIRRHDVVPFGLEYQIAADAEVVSLIKASIDDVKKGGVLAFSKSH